VSRRVVAAIAWIGVSLLCHPEARSAAIHKESTAVSADAQALSQSWSEYLLGGPTVWANVPHPAVTPQVESQIWQAIKTDPGESDAIVQYLVWKQSQDPSRFAYYHPKLSKALDKLTSTPPTAPQQITPPPSTTPTGGSAPTEPQTIPEPRSVLLALGLLGWGVAWRLRRN
jgi:hypothetical protein